VSSWLVVVVMAITMAAPQAPVVLPRGDPSSPCRVTPMTTFRWLVVPMRGVYAAYRRKPPPKRGH